jgi:hypothetical protein
MNIFNDEKSYQVLLNKPPSPTFPQGGRSRQSLSPLGETGKGVHTNVRWKERATSRIARRDRGFVRCFNKKEGHKKYNFHI